MRSTINTLAALLFLITVPVWAQPKPPFSPKLTVPPGKKKPAPPPSKPATKDIVLPAPHKHDEGHKKGVLLDLNFDKMDILDVIKWISEWTDRNFIIPERGIQGKITILSPVKVTVDEAYQAFLAALDANGLALYQVGKYYKLGPKAELKKASIPTYLPDDTAPIPLDERFITKLIKLSYIEADPARNVLAPFLGKDGEIVTFPTSTLIITDTALNLHRLERILDQIDAPGGSDEVRVVQVEYASAQEVAQKLNEIFAKQGGAPGGASRIGIAEAIPPGGIAHPGAPSSTNAAAGQSEGGAVSVYKILPDERTNKLIIIASPRSFDRILALLKKLDVPTSGEGQVHVYYLENAKAEEISATLQALEQGTRGKGAPAAPGAGARANAAAELFSGEVKITADKATNSLVIIASSSDYRTLSKVIERLDLRRRQVFVEAVIMEVNLSDDTKLGISAHGGAVIPDVTVRGQTGPVPIVLGSEPGNPGGSLSLASLLGLGGFLAGVQGPAVSTALGINIPSFGFILNAAQSDSDVNVLSTPHILTSDNQEAEITVGQNVPFISGAAPQLSGLSSLAGAAGTTGTNPLAALGGLGLGGIGGLFPQVQRTNVELKLKIKPQINESDFVRMEVDEQTEEIASISPSLGPTTAKRSAKTTIVARDQQTVVIGGLVQDRVSHSVDKIPILGSIPVLGWLFRNDTEKKQKTNLLLFLTPYIIRDQADFRRIFEQKMKEREEFVRRFYGESAAYKVTIDYSRKKGPITDVVQTIDRELGKIENGGSSGTVIGHKPTPRGNPEGVPMPPGSQPPKETQQPVVQPPPAPAPSPADPQHLPGGAEPDEDDIDHGR